MNTIEQSKRQYSKDDLQLRLETEYHVALLLSYILDTQLLLANTKAENDKKWTNRTELLANKYNWFSARNKPILCWKCCYCAFKNYVQLKTELTEKVENVKPTS